MSRNRKTVYKGFSYLQCDDFAAYLSRMAEQGWHFREWKAGLVFERGEPEKAEYAVEVFIDGSEYDTRPEVHTKEFAAYCEAAGWQMVDAKRKFVIFKKTRQDAVEIMTPRERLDNIAAEEKKDILSKMALSYTWTVLQFLNMFSSSFVNLIFSNTLLLVSALWFTMAVSATIRLFFFLIWKKSCIRKIENDEAVYFGAGKNPFAYSNRWNGFLIWGFLLLYFAGLILSEDFGILIFILAFTVGMGLMGYLIARFRPDAVTNQIIQVIASALLFVGFMTASVLIIISDNSEKPMLQQDLPLYYADIGREAGEPVRADVDQSTSLFGTGSRYKVDYKGDYLYYDVYTSDHSWVVDRVWNELYDRAIFRNGEDAAQLFGAEAAIRADNGYYIVKYTDAVLFLRFGEDMLLSSEEAESIRVALLESR